MKQPKYKPIIAKNHGYELINIVNLDNAPNILKRMSGKSKNIIVSKRNKIFVRDNFTCKHCGRRAKYILTVRNYFQAMQSVFCYVDEENDYVALTLDHVYPRSLGGSKDLENLQVLCKPCNTKKGNNIDEYQVYQSG